MSFLDKLWDNVAVLKNKILYTTGHHKIYSVIPNENIIIGEIPTEENGLQKTLLSLGVTDIVSLVEDFEYEPNLFHTPIKKDIIKKNFNLMHFPAKDRYHPDHNKVVILLDNITTAIRNGKKIYIHCRSGIGRSALIGILYIMIEYDSTFDNAIEFIKEYRSEINLSTYQKIFGDEMCSDIEENTAYIMQMIAEEHIV